MANVSDQQKLELERPNNGLLDVDKYDFEPIQGYPMLNWRGKRPFRSTQYYPAQLKEQHGPEAEGWRNRIYWGDNLQVMSHLLKEYRGKVKLVYMDPPFDSKADYRKKVTYKTCSATSDYIGFEDKQYSDIWSNDEYLQFMFERLCITRELLAEDGSVWVHSDWHRSHHIRCILEEIFGSSNLQNEVIWQRTDPHNDAKSRLGWIHDTLFWFAKNRQQVKYRWADVTSSLSASALKEYSLIKLTSGKVEAWNEITPQEGRRFKLDDCTYKGEDMSRRFEWRGARPSNKRVWPYGSVIEMDAAVDRGEFFLRDANKGAARCRVSFLDQREGQLLQSIWTDTGRMKGGVDYPTQKPLSLMERIVKCCTDHGDIVIDPFMGSGSLLIAAMKTGRRFIGADINLGAIQITTKRLVKILDELKSVIEPVQVGFDLLKTEGAAEDPFITTDYLTEPICFYPGFEVYNVNHYDVFRNPVQAKELLIEAMEIQPLGPSSVYDGEKDGRMVKIMPVNRIATRADLSELTAGFDWKAFDRRQKDNPRQPVEKILLVCMGHEPDLAATLVKEAAPYKIDVEVVDILRDKANLEFKRDAEADVLIQNGRLVVRAFYPMNLLQKLSLLKEEVEDWRQLVESIMVDWNYDGAVLTPAVVDLPGKNELVAGSYAVPDDAGTIRIKITDLLAESLEMELPNG